MNTYNNYKTQTLHRVPTILEKIYLQFVSQIEYRTYNGYDT